MAFMAAMSPILSAISAGVSILGTLSSMGKKNDSAPPPVSSPTAMPDPDDARVAQARRRSLAMQQSRQGRESTILTETPDAKLGG